MSWFSSSPKFRTTPKSASRLQYWLTCLQHQHPELLSSNVPSSQEARALIAEIDSGWTKKQFLPLVFHPDERVGLALLEQLVELYHTNKGPMDAMTVFPASDPNQELKKVLHIWGRLAQTEATQEGALWTPRLDTWARLDAQELVDAPGGSPVKIGERMRKLQEWLKGCQEPDKIEPLTEFRSRKVLSQMAAYTSAWSEQLAEKFFRRLREERLILASQLADNHHIPAHGLSKLDLSFADFNDCRLLASHPQAQVLDWEKLLREAGIAAAWRLLNNEHVSFSKSTKAVARLSPASLLDFLEEALRQDNQEVWREVDWPQLLSVLGNSSPEHRGQALKIFARFQRKESPSVASRSDCHNPRSR